jgi:two-component system osmolarity sensor histidine kinase EnvZ
MKGESGLGMTISRDIIRSHGGDIKLSPSSIGGLKTVINLPI